MRKYLKIFSSVLLLSSCILMMLSGSIPDLLPERNYSDKIISYWEQHSPEIPLASSKSESLFHEVREYSSESSQNFFQKIWFNLVKAGENPVNSYFRKYFLTDEISNRYHKSDFLYPFHFFL